MSEPGEQRGTDWRRIGLVAAVLLVPGGFLLGAALAARRLRERADAETPAPDERANAPKREADFPAPTRGAIDFTSA